MPRPQSKPKQRRTPLSSPKPTETLRQINEAWESAQQRLQDLRAAVERTGQLADLKVQGELLTRDRDRALRDLGEAVWGLLSAEELELPEHVQEVVDRVAAVDRKRTDHAANVKLLLAEGAEVADRLRRQGSGGPRKGLAGGPKKR